MSSESDLKSPFSNVFHILPKGHDKALRKAFYNVAAILFIIFASGIAIAIYYILQPFLRPLLWALLCGTFLYPFKYKLASCLKKWLEKLHSSRTPLVLGSVTLPFVLVNSSIDALGNTFWKNIKIIVGSLICISITLSFVALWPLQGITNLAGKSFCAIEEVLSYFNSYLIWSLVLGYIVVVILFCNEKSKFSLKILSLLLWGAVFFHLVNTFKGPVVIALSLVVIVLVIGGFLAEIINLKIKAFGNVKKRNTKEDSPLTQSSSDTCLNTNDSEAKKLQKRFESDSNNHMLLSLNECEEVKKKPFSDYCLLTLMWCIILLQLWIYKALLLIIPMLLLCIFVKSLGNYFEIWSSMHKWFSLHALHLRDKITSDHRWHVIVPKPIRIFLKLLLEGDSKVTKMLEKSIDKICSAFIVVMLLVVVGLFAVFAALEVHKESMHLVQVSSNVFNRSQHPELTRWLPEDEVLQSALDSMVKNAYVYGREWIGRQLNGFLHGDDVSKCHIEKQVLKLWDTLYNSWLNTNRTIELYEKPLSLNDLSINSSLPYFYQRMKKMNLNIIAIAKENVDLFMSVIKSVWSVLVSNVALTVKILTSMMSVIFGGGTAIFNTFLSMVIFLTTLFYLLASSGEQYKPVELFCSLSPAYLDKMDDFKFGRAFQDAIGSVFLVSLKMSAFYGLYTWFTHSLLGIQIIFIPSVLAAIFAAVPFLGTYVAALPAILELWIVNGQPLHALLLFAAHYLPSFFVDTAFYSEIKGGHPYLTGLAILGGIYWMGLEGAIIGPVLLCCFVVAMHMYQSMLQPEAFCDQSFK